MSSGLLGPGEIRALADSLGIRPTKTRGQNFVIDPNTVRKIVALSGVGPADVVLEVGPGLGSLTLALLPAVAQVVAVEIDPALAAQLPLTVAAHAPDLVGRLRVDQADALHWRPPGDDTPPTALVANLPYNVAVPLLLTLLAEVPSIARVLVMVQLEVAQRLVAQPGSRVYGVPSVKARWFGRVSLAGTVGRKVFWPAPNVDSGLVALERTPPPVGVARSEVFAVVDAAFAQRRKMLRSALAPWAGGREQAETILARAGVDPTARGESLGLAGFVAIAKAREGVVS